MTKLLICLISLLLILGCSVGKKNLQYDTTQYYKITHKKEKWFDSPEYIINTVSKVYCAKVIQQYDSIDITVTKEPDLIRRECDNFFEYSMLKDTIVANWQDVNRYFYRMFLFDKKVALRHKERYGVKNNSIEFLSENKHPSGNQIDFRMTSCHGLENEHFKGQIHRKKKSIILKGNQSFPVSGIFNGIVHEIEAGRINETKYQELKETICSN